MGLQKKILVGYVAFSSLIFVGASSVRSSFSAGRNTSGEIARHVSLLKFGDAQQKAAAAYWLGQQHASAVKAISYLAPLLADATQVDPRRYRRDFSETAPEQKPTLGEEVAAAMVNIGRASTDALIEVLKSSPHPHARKNAAWALGALRESEAPVPPRGAA
jgi:HEAT repeat protein